MYTTLYSHHYHDEQDFPPVRNDRNNNAPSDKLPLLCLLNKSFRHRTSVRHSSRRRNDNNEYDCPHKTDVAPAPLLSLSADKTARLTELLVQHAMQDLVCDVRWSSPTTNSTGSSSSSSSCACKIRILITFLLKHL